MSRSYSISIPVTVLLPRGAGMREGSFSLVFNLLEILPAPKMRELLKQKLLDKGYEETAEGLCKPCEKATQAAVLDLETMTMKVSVAMPERCTVFVEEEYLDKFQENLRKALESGKVIDSWQVSDAVESAKARVVDELKTLAVQARLEVNTALKETYREAIREKAASLGNVENVTESQDGNTYRIRIEVSG